MMLSVDSVVEGLLQEEGQVGVNYFVKEGTPPERKAHDLDD